MVTPIDFADSILKKIVEYVGDELICECGRATSFPIQGIRKWNINNEYARRIHGINFECVKTYIHFLKKMKNVIHLQTIA